MPNRFSLLIRHPHTTPCPPLTQQGQQETQLEGPRTISCLQLAKHSLSDDGQSTTSQVAASAAPRPCQWSDSGSDLSETCFKLCSVHVAAAASTEVQDETRPGRLGASSSSASFSTVAVQAGSPASGGLRVATYQAASATSCGTSCGADVRVESSGTPAVTASRADAATATNAEPASDVEAGGGGTVTAAAAVLMGDDFSAAWAVQVDLDFVRSKCAALLAADSVRSCARAALPAQIL